MRSGVADTMSRSCFVDVVSVASQIVTAIVGIFGAWVGYKTLLRTPEQQPEPDKAALTAGEKISPTSVTVFKTSKQETQLRATDAGLECHLEDNRPGRLGGVQWRFTKKEAKEILDARDFRVYPGYRLYSGVFSIGPRRNWLYSKKLYPEPELLELEIEKLLRDTNT